MRINYKTTKWSWIPILALTLTLSVTSAFAAEKVKSKQDNNTKGDVARGVKAWSENCMRCHNARDPREYSDDLWKPIITHMRIRAGLTGQQARDILEYFKQSN